MAERKPRVDPLVPTYELDRKLGRTHVGTPDAEVQAMVEAQLAKVKDPRWTPALKRQTVKYALWRHHRNRAEYVSVMGGHHRRRRAPTTHAAAVRRRRRR